MRTLESGVDAPFAGVFALLNLSDNIWQI